MKIILCISLQKTNIFYMQTFLHTPLKTIYHIYDYYNYIQLEQFVILLSHLSNIKNHYVYSCFVT